MHFQKSCHKIRDDKGADTFRDLVGKYVCRGAAAVRCLGVAVSRAAAACEPQRYEQRQPQCAWSVHETPPAIESPMSDPLVVGAIGSIAAVSGCAGEGWGPRRSPAGKGVVGNARRGLGRSAQVATAAVVIGQAAAGVTTAAVARRLGVANTDAARSAVLVSRAAGETRSRLVSHRNVAVPVENIVAVGV